MISLSPIRQQPRESRLACMARGSGMTQAALLATFRRSMADDLSQVRHAAQCGDFALVATLAHRVTGACQMLGAADFTRACAGLACAAEAASGTRVAAALDLFERRLAALDRPPP